MSHWVHDLDPVIFQFTETLAVRWYGLAYVCGFLIAFGLLRLYWKRGRSVLNPNMQESLAMALILGVLVGGRVGYFLLYEPGNLIRDPLVLFRVWEGGMASHGGFVGVALAGLWVARKFRIPALQLGDSAGPAPRADRELHQRGTLGKGVGCSLGGCFSRELSARHAGQPDPASASVPIV